MVRIQMTKFAHDVSFWSNADVKKCKRKQDFID